MLPLRFERRPLPRGTFRIYLLIYCTLQPTSVERLWSFRITGWTVYFPLLLHYFSSGEAVDSDILNFVQGGCRRNWARDSETLSHGTGSSK